MGLEKKNLTIDDLLDQVEDPRVYIAGKYSGDDVVYNITLAETFGTILMNHGIKTYIPHKATAHLENCAPYDYFLDLHMSVLDKWANAIYLLPNWKDSYGARKEYEFALDNSKLIWYSEDFDKMIDFYTKKNK